jgi:serine/threonine-protein kinase HipA
MKTDDQIMNILMNCILVGRLIKNKMAMALRGKNNHYHWQDIQRRHFLTMAEIAHNSQKRAEELLNEMLEKVDFVLQQVSAKLPSNFPINISQSIFDGMLLAKSRLSKI